MNQTFNEHSGAKIMKDCAQLRKLLIQMTFFGVMCVLEVRVGKKLGTIYAECRRAYSAFAQ